jgi:hypothetical protein
VSKLSAAERKATPASEFGGAGRTFPLTDASHDRAALSGVVRSEHAGNISKATGDRIAAKARSKLAHSVGKCAHGDCDSDAAFGG